MCWPVRSAAASKHCAAGRGGDDDVCGIHRCIGLRAVVQLAELGEVLLKGSIGLCVVADIAHLCGRRPSQQRVFELHCGLHACAKHANASRRLRGEQTDAPIAGSARARGGDQVAIEQGLRAAGVGVDQQNSGLVRGRAQAAVMAPKASGFEAHQALRLNRARFDAKHRRRRPLAERLAHDGVGIALSAAVQLKSFARSGDYALRLNDLLEIISIEDEQFFVGHRITSHKTVAKQR